MAKKKVIEISVDSSSKFQSKEEILQNTIKEIEKKYGKGVIQIAVDAPQEVIRIPSGNFVIDVEIGGGNPIGRWGSVRSKKESEGKTNYLMHCVRQFTSRKQYVIWVDGENTIEGNLKYFKSAGVDLNYMLLVYGEKAEIMGEVAIEIIKKGIVGALFLDSNQSLLLDYEDEKKMDEGQGNVGMKQANFMASLVRRLIFASRERILEYTKDGQTDIQGFKRNSVTLFSVDRLNPVIAQGSFQSSIPTFKSSGGQHKENAYSWKLDLSKGEWLTQGSGDTRNDYAQENKFIISKNKTFARNKRGTYDLYFADFGNFKSGQIDNLKAIHTLGLKYEVIEKLNSSTYGYKEHKYTGKDNLHTLGKRLICSIMIDIVKAVNPKCIFYDDIDTEIGKITYFKSYFPKCYNYPFDEETKKVLKGFRKKV